MEFNEYQSHALSTKTVTAFSSKVELARIALGISGEAGEVAEQVKKYLRGDFDENELHTRLYGELGDVLWYIAVLADEVGLDLNSVAVLNVDKLASRRKRDVIKGDGDNR